MANEEENGYGTFTTTNGPDFCVIDFTPAPLTGDDAVDTTSNCNDRVRSKEPGQFYELGDTSIVVRHSYSNQSALESLINVKDTGTLTSKSGSTVVGEGWFKSYTPDTSSPSDAPTATIEWCNYTGNKGQTLPVTTPTI